MYKGDMGSEVSHVLCDDTIHITHIYSSMNQILNQCLKAYTFAEQWVDRSNIGG